MTLRKNALFVLAALGFAALLTAPIAQAGSCGSAKSASAYKDCASSCTSVQKAAACPSTCTQMQKAAACPSVCTQMQKAAACPSVCTQMQKAAADFCELDASTCSAKIRDYYKAHGWFGVEMDLAGCDAGPTVTRVHAASPAAAAGLQAGDVITSVNGISAAPQYRDQLDAFMKSEFKPGKKIRFTAKRGNDIIPMRAELVEIPSDTLDQMVAFHLDTNHQGQPNVSTAENVQ